MQLSPSSQSAMSSKSSVVDIWCFLGRVGKDVIDGYRFVGVLDGVYGCERTNVGGLQMFALPEYAAVGNTFDLLHGWPFTRHR